MRFAGLRDYASVGDHFFGDRFPLYFCDLHLRDRPGCLFLLPSAESLRDPHQRRDDDNERYRADEGSPFHFEFSIAFDGR